MSRVIAEAVLVLLFAPPITWLAADGSLEPCEDRDFSCGDIQTLAERGLEGDAHAALKLSWLYADRDDERAQVFWTRVAVENGSVIARHNYAVLLSQRSERACLVRSRLLLSTLIKEGLGDATAPALLKTVEVKLASAGQHAKSESVPCGL